MSWDAWLQVDLGERHEPIEIAEWNYTHNCNGMIREAIDPPATNADDHFLVGYRWWQNLDGKSAADGFLFLVPIVAALELDPKIYRAMNPDNGWGDYDTLLKTLTEMRDRSAEYAEIPYVKWAVQG